LADPARLAAVREARLLDTPAEEALDRLARLAARLLDAPTALVSLVDAERQFFKSALGLSEPWASARETPLSYSFCRHAVESSAPFVVPNAREHPLVRDNPAIEALGVEAYAGVPLLDSQGHALGTLCVIDSHPREWTPAQLETLRELAGATMSTIEFRRAAEPRAAAGAAPPAGQAPDAGLVAEPRRRAERLAHVADALWRATGQLLEAVDRYDHLVRTGAPTPENLAREAQALAEKDAARGRMEASLAEYDVGLGLSTATSGAADAPADALTHRAGALRAAVVEYLRVHRRRTEVEDAFQRGRTNLREFEAAIVALEHAEFVLREAAATYAVAG
jgi:hypothetical protein